MASVGRRRRPRTGRGVRRRACPGTTVGSGKRTGATRVAGLHGPGTGPALSARGDSRARRRRGDRCGGRSPRARDRADLVSGRYAERRDDRGSRRLAGQQRPDAVPRLTGLVARGPGVGRMGPRHRGTRVGLQRTDHQVRGARPACVLEREDPAPGAGCARGADRGSDPPGRPGHRVPVPLRHSARSGLDLGGVGPPERDEQRVARADGCRRGGDRGEAGPGENGLRVGRDAGRAADGHEPRVRVAAAVPPGEGGGEVARGQDAAPDPSDEVVGVVRTGLDVDDEVPPGRAREAVGPAHHLLRQDQVSGLQHTGAGRRPSHRAGDIPAARPHRGRRRRRPALGRRTETGRGVEHLRLQHVAGVGCRRVEGRRRDRDARRSGRHLGQPGAGQEHDHHRRDSYPDRTTGARCEVGGHPSDGRRPQRFRPGPRVMPIAPPVARQDGQRRQHHEQRHQGHHRTVGRPQNRAADQGDQ